MKKMSALLLSVILLLSMAACGPATDAGNEATPSAAALVTLAISENNNYEGSYFVTPQNRTIIPATYGSGMYMNSFYETLINYENGEYVPGLAKSWTVSDDGLFYTFKLVEGRKFSDGTPVNAAAVKLNFDALPAMMGEFAGGYGVTSGNVESATVVDEMTVTIKLKKPYYATLNDLTVVNPHGIMSPNAFGEDLRPSEATKSASFGTGPYMYAGDYENNILTFVRNPEYYGELPDADKITVRTIIDPEAAVLALRKGEIDFIAGIDRIGLDAYTELGATPPFTSKEGDDFEFTRFLTLNTKRYPFNDLNVRKAVAMGIDKQALSNIAYYGVAVPTDNLFHESYPYCAGLAPVPSLDLEAALTLLAENGYVDTDGDGVREKNGQKLAVQFRYNASTTTEDSAVLVMAAQLKALGFEVEIFGTDLVTWIGAITEGNFDLAYGYTWGSGHDPFTIVSNMSAANARISPNVSQVGEMNAEVDALITTLGALTDKGEIQNSYNLIFKHIAEKVPIIPLLYISGIATYNSEIVADYGFGFYVRFIDFAEIKMVK